MIDAAVSHLFDSLRAMADLIEIGQRFGTVEVTIDAECPACGGPIDGVLVAADDVLCGGCGLPVVA